MVLEIFTFCPSKLVNLNPGKSSANVFTKSPKIVIATSSPNRMSPVNVVTPIDDLRSSRPRRIQVPCVNLATVHRFTFVAVSNLLPHNTETTRSGTALKR